MNESFEVRFRLRCAAPSAPRRIPESMIEAGVGDAQSGKLPRITQVLALAILFDEMVHAGVAKDYADLARLGCVTRERISQIMKLRWLAPDIQQEILGLPRTPSGRFAVCETELRRVAEEICWTKQRPSWRSLKASRV